MSLWLLSHLQASPGNRLVLEAAERLGVEARLVRPQDLDVWLPRDGAPAVRERGQPVELPARILTRMGGSAPEGAFDVLAQLEALGVPCRNRAAPLRTARDKVRAHQALARAGLPQPDTLVLGPDSPAACVPELLGDAPWILKLPLSTQGLGVARADSLPSLRSVLDVLRSLGQRVLVQRYVKEAAGTDLRIFVLDGRARAGMTRRAQGDELRSNLHRGGQAQPLELTAELRQIAEGAARALDLEIAGVDLVPSPDGPLVLEVNGSPGLEGLQGATGLDLAGELVQRLATLAE